MAKDLVGLEEILAPTRWENINRQEPSGTVSGGESIDSSILRKKFEEAALNILTELTKRSSESPRMERLKLRVERLEREVEDLKRHIGFVGAVESMTEVQFLLEDERIRCLHKRLEEEGVEFV